MWLLHTTAQHCCVAVIWKLGFYLGSSSTSLLLLVVFRFYTILQHQSTITRRMEEKQSYWLCFFTLAVVTSVVFAAVPSAPVKLTISHIKPKSVQLTWDKSKSDDVLSYIIQYRPYSDESKEFKEISGITKTRGYKVHLLEPYTRYEFRVIAVNKDGRSPPSETVQELTAPQG